MQLVEQTEKSSITDHTLNPDIRFQNTQVLTQSTIYHIRLHFEGREIHKHKENLIGEKKVSELTNHLDINTTLRQERFIRSLSTDRSISSREDAEQAIELHLNVFYFDRLSFLN